MFFKRVLLNMVIVSVIIAIACYLNEKVGFSISGFYFTSLDFTNPITYAAIVVLSLFLTLMTSFSLGYLRSAGIVFAIVIVLMLFFDFYYNTNQDEKTGRYITTPEEQVESKREVSSDSLHVGIKTIFLLSKGGTIDATCDNDYVIIIEAQDNETSSSWNRLIYNFSTRDEYMDALNYMNKKGYRWIINHQFETEYSWDAKHKITYEGHGDEMKTFNTMRLSTMKKK